MSKLRERHLAFVNKLRLYKGRIFLLKVDNESYAQVLIVCSRLAISRKFEMTTYRSYTSRRLYYLNNSAHRAHVTDEKCIENSSHAN